MYPWKVIIIITIAALCAVAVFIIVAVCRYIPGYSHRYEVGIIAAPFAALISWLIRKYKQL